MQTRSDVVELSVDPSRCIVCGEPNDCARARNEDESAPPCWCVAEKFPTTLVEWLAKEKGQQSCLCQSCLARPRAGESLPGQEESG